MSCVLFTFAQTTDDAVWHKKELRILDIGNSYTEDVLAYLPALVKAAGINTDDICLYKLISGGSSIQTWCNTYHGQNQKTYTFRKVLGGLTCSHIVSNSNGAKGDSTLIHEILDECKWDVIIFHEVSNRAPYYEKYDGIDELLSIIREHQSDAILGTYLIHSYWGDYSGNKEKSSVERWRLIANTTKRICDNYGIDFIIPYGTAIENLRLTSFNMEGGLTRDGTHLGYGMARYTAACCYFESIFRKRYNISILGNILTYDTTKDIQSSSPKYESGCISVTQENRLLAQQTAISACIDMFDLYKLELNNVDFIQFNFGTGNSTRKFMVKNRFLIKKSLCLYNQLGMMLE